MVATMQDTIGETGIAAVSTITIGHAIGNGRPFHNRTRDRETIDTNDGRLFTLVTSFVTHHALHIAHTTGYIAI